MKTEGMKELMVEWIDGEEWIFAEPISSVKEKIELKMKMED